MYEELRNLFDLKFQVQRKIENQIKKDVKIGSEIIVEKNCRNVSVIVLDYGYDGKIFVRNNKTGKQYWVGVWDILNANPPE